jgi:Secretion system C-terminal sorting domain
MGRIYFLKLIYVRKLNFFMQKNLLGIKSFILLILILIIKPVFSQSKFIIIGLPDTQYYSENLGGGEGSISTFIAQTNWIVNNRVDSNIVYVAHFGDCVQDGDEVEQEWINGSDAMSYLEDPSTTGLLDGIPYGVAVGNHDMTPWDYGTTNFYNKYFGIDRFSGRAYYGGHYGSNNDNHFDIFQVGLLKFIAIYIKYGEFDYNPDALHWANVLLSTYNDRLGIIISHKILDNDSGTQVNFSTQGQVIFDSLKNNSNLFLMLCGHFTQDGRRTETNGAGKPVYILMSDYQDFSNGGDGYLRIIRFNPLKDSIYVSTYSPTLNAFLPGGNSDFALPYDFQSLLPVGLSIFTGTVNKDKILLKWRTETELNNHGFDIERSTDNTHWKSIVFIEGNGNSNSPKNYSYTDNYPPFGKVYYRLKQEDNDGKFEYSNIINFDLSVTSNVELYQNYPNPFNPTTIIEYSLPKGSHALLKVYDSLGREVAILKNEYQVAGRYSVEFNSSKLASGIYLYTLTTDSFNLSRKMIFLK